jgi:phosphohistidine phosphatase
MNTKQKILYLVRHAKSSWSDPSLSDRERPLNKRGRRSAPEMGRRMELHGHRPDLIISSPAKRANSTARKIAKELGIDVADIVTDEALYFSGGGSTQRMLGGLDDRYRKVMIVGHNPAMTGLMSTLGNTSIYNMPTCAIAVIGFDTRYWADLHSTDGELLAYDFPKGGDGLMMESKIKARVKSDQL